MFYRARYLYNRQTFNLPARSEAPQRTYIQCETETSSLPNTFAIFSLWLMYFCEICQFVTNLYPYIIIYFIVMFSKRLHACVSAKGGHFDHMIDGQTDNTTHNT